MRGTCAWYGSSLIPLIDRLNRYPVGLVDSDKLRTILSLLFTEQEAFVASRFPLHEATEEELTELTGLAATAQRPVLEAMADKGLVMDLSYGGTTYYLLTTGVQDGFADGIAKTPFIAEVDAAHCNYCGDCLKTCNVTCIGLADGARARPKDERYAELDAAVCLGCGAWDRS